jgi:hypothetical protein
MSIVQLNGFGRIAWHAKAKLGHMRQPILSRRVVLIGKTAKQRDRCLIVAGLKASLALCQLPLRYRARQRTS